MHHFNKLTASIIATLFLASCSSGGSSSSTQTPTTPLPDKTPPPSINPEPKPEATKTETGKYLKIVASNGAEKATTGSINSSNLDMLKIEDKTIVISYPNIYAGTWTMLNNTATCCGKTDYSKIGYYSDEPAMSYMFFNGDVTPEMPNSGIAEYNGYFLYRGANSAKGDLIDGTANYKADFVNKEFTGELKADSVSIGIQANIEGNKLTGTAQSSLDSSKGIVSGGFYGPNAAEVAGMIESTKAGKTEWTGVFNGKQ